MKKNPQLRFDVITLFPSMVEGPLKQSVIGRGQQAGLIEIRVHDLRQWSDDRHQKVDDRPYGGGPGMVLKAEPVYQALKAMGALRRRKKPWIIFLTPQGHVFKHQDAVRLSKKRHVVLLCGHYEGVDERIMPWIDEEISIGDVVLTGGEIPAMVVIDASSRLVKGVVGDPKSVEHDSFVSGLLDCPHYTRPQTWRRKAVPDVLMSGHAARISEWREEQALKVTKKKRPDLLN